MQLALLVGERWQSLKSRERVDASDRKYGDNGGGEGGTGTGSGKSKCERFDFWMHAEKKPKQTKRRVCGEAPVVFLPQSRRPSGGRRSITRWAGRRVRSGEAGPGVS